MAETFAALCYWLHVRKFWYHCLCSDV